MHIMHKIILIDLVTFKYWLGTELTLSVAIENIKLQQPVMK